jgi:hypothetical protein
MHKYVLRKNKPITKIQCFTSVKPSTLTYIMMNEVAVMTAAKTADALCDCKQII